MRRTREKAAETRRQAVETASRLYRERGLDQVSVNDVMAAIGMTVGGFYRHFESKDALVSEACGLAFEEARRNHDAAVASGEGHDPLIPFFRRYLSRAHRDAPASGCPVPALLSSAPRQPARVRRIFTDAIRRTISTIERLSPGADPEAHVAAVASMFGALALARAVDDEALSARILHDTRRYWPRTLRSRSRTGSAPNVAGPRRSQRQRSATVTRRDDR